MASEDENHMDQSGEDSSVDRTQFNPMSLRLWPNRSQVSFVESLHFSSDCVGRGSLENPAVILPSEGRPLWETMA